MLPLRHRLRHERDFRTVFGKGKRRKYRFFTAVFLQHSRETSSRIGIVVGAKAAGKAFQRNRFKRQMRGVVGKFLERLPGGYDIVLIAAPPTRASQRSLEEDFRNLLQNLGGRQNHGA